MNRLLRALWVSSLGALIVLVATLGATPAGAAQGAPRAGVAQGAPGPTVEVFTLSGVLDSSLLGDLRNVIAGAESLRLTEIGRAHV